jgi:hypothetical protein
MTNSALPRVFVVVPGVENFETVIGLLQAAGAQITSQRREFVVEGPLTVEQATAAHRLSRFVDSGSEGYALDVRVEPLQDVDAALAALCPEGFAPPAEEETDDAEEFASWYDDAYFKDLPTAGNAHNWWAEQQKRQREIWAGRQAVRSVPPTARACCGEGGSWAPKAGEPFVTGCALCPQSSTYWRASRADGRSYEPVRALSADDA